MKTLDFPGMLPQDDKKSLSYRDRIVSPELLGRTCAECGAGFQTYIRPQHICPKCHKEANRRFEGRSLEEVKLYEVPAKHAKYPLDTRIAAKIGEDRLVCLNGPTGTGKTCAAHHALAQFSRHVNQAAFLTCSEAGLAMKDNWRYYLDVRALVVDDLGRHMSKASIEACSRLAEHRSAKRLVTVFTTNFDRNHFATIDERLYSRLHDFTWIRLGGDDKRIH